MTIIKKFEPEEPKRKFPKKIIGLTLGILFVLTLVEIWVSNTVVVYGEKFEELAALQTNLVMENQILENEIAKDSSLFNISSKSAQLGFSSQQSIKYIR
ncbi:MAG: Uncharacterized protein G01um10147_424 [Microgenomates group bacterium Gr01-1014_7]|nr:MAG: Uncharacterized protein G01um10147_424 [Microgenomates group bacterium Gr01-1014_7]